MSAYFKVPAEGAAAPSPSLAVLAIAAAAIGLASCLPPSGPTGEGAQAVAPAAPVVPGVDRYRRSDSLWKVCDEGRAIYALESGYRRGSGLAVVENAPECTQ